MGRPAHRRGTGVSAWKAPPQHLALGAGDVHVWRARLDVPSPSLARASATLIPEEHVRAAAFAYEKDARRFVVARAALRLVLARYVGVPPHRVRMAAGPHGKPRLIGGDDHVEFNLSHAAELAVYAVASRRAVGVDVEQIRHDLAEERVATRVLSAREAAALAAAPGSRRTETFFDLWTRKEAYAKGLGVGLAGMDALDVLTEPPGWRLVPLAAGPGFAATLAVEGTQCRLSFWELAI